MLKAGENVKWFQELSNKDISIAGGKGASLAEMINNKFPVPPGFVITAHAYDLFIEKSGLKDKIESLLSNVDFENTDQLEKAAKDVRGVIVASNLPLELESEIVENYDILGTPSLEGATTSAKEILRKSKESTFVAVRSSATTEDLADASFAGQQESFLNVKGQKQLLEAVKKCIASLFTARAVYYRHKKGFPLTGAKLAVVVQKMVNSDKSGVMFSHSPVSDKDEIMIEAVFGLGEGIVSGMINPDNYIVSPEFKLLSTKLANKKIALVRNASGENQVVKLNEDISARQVLSSYEIKILSQLAKKLEEHYKKPQDIEFAISGQDIYIVQSRPITTKFEASKKKEFQSEAILSGLGASPGISSGPVKVIYKMDDLSKIKKGDILVTEMTNPDMVVSMQKSAGIITDEGGATAHASIVSREMGIPCFSGDTIILTNKGFMLLEEVYGMVSDGDELYTLSFDVEKLKVEWKKILNTSKRNSKAWTISISKNGKVDWNTLTTTPEHKFFAINNFKGDYKKIKDILVQDRMVYTAIKMPELTKNITNFTEQKAYIAGAIFSDGHLRIRPDGTSSTVFVQNDSPHKQLFIQEVCSNFEKAYNYPLRLVNKDYYYCYKKEITKDLLDIYSKIDYLLLSCPSSAILKYLSSVIDGDGNFIARGNYIKISIDATDIQLLNSLIISCLRLGFAYRIRRENNEFRFYITSGIEKLKPFLKRVIIKSLNKSTGDIYFPSTHLFANISLPGRKGIKSFPNKNCLISEREIKQKIIPYINERLKDSISRIMDSDIGALRAIKIAEKEKIDVYNIEVEDNHNYVVFTKFFTPIIVKNCVVGTEKATKLLKDGDEVTVDGFAGKVYAGKGESKAIEIKQILPTKTKIKVIVDLPDYAERAAKTGAKAVGLVRLEGIIAESGCHPLYFVKESKLNEYTALLVKGLSKITEHFKEVWVRTSDIRSDEYRNLKGAPQSKEENPMLGDHGARFSLKHKDIMRAEVAAIKKLADKNPDKTFGIMVPQIISLEELETTKKIASSQGIEKGESNVKIGIMVETPAAVQIINELCESGLDFISFGTNDLTQYMLAIDRGNEEIQNLFNEMNPAVLSAISYVIRRCKKYGVETSICGQAASRPEMAEFLVKEGIDSVSVNADAAYTISEVIARIENQSKAQKALDPIFDDSESESNNSHNKDVILNTTDDIGDNRVKDNNAIKEEIEDNVLQDNISQNPIQSQSNNLLIEDIFDMARSVAEHQDIQDVVLQELSSKSEYSPGEKKSKEIPSLNDSIPIDSEQF